MRNTFHYFICALICMSAFSQHSLSNNNMQDISTIKSKNKEWLKKFSDSLNHHLDCNHLNITNWRECVAYRLKLLANDSGSKSYEVDFLPHSHICDGNIDSMANYRVCNIKTLHSLAGKDGCVIMSLGSKNQWGFERAVYNYTKCEIHTFDMSYSFSPPPDISDRTFYHPKGISSKISPRHNLVGLANAIAMSNVTVDRPLLILKIDIEGHEYVSIRSLLAEYHKTHSSSRRDILLPHMLVGEFHQRVAGFPYATPPQDVHGSLLGLAQAGYVVFDKRVVHKAAAIELGFVRI